MPRVENNDLASMWVNNQRVINTQIGLCRASLVILLLLIMPSAYATLSGLSTDSASYSLASNTSSSIQVQWQGTSDSVSSNLVLGVNYQVVSTSAQLTDSSGRINVAVSSSISATLQTPGVSPFSIRERIRLPRSVLATANRYGITQLRYQREFFDESDGTAAVGVTVFATIRLSNTASGAINIEQIDLRFSDERVIATVLEQDALSAFAVITHSGTGRFDAIWEIALPSSTKGTPLFTTLKTERRFLSGRGKTQIDAPTLPAAQIGKHLLRLRVFSPEINFQFNQLEYFVLRGESLIKMSGLKPYDRSVVDASTEFSWQRIREAVAYQIEVYQRKPSAQPDFLRKTNGTNWVHPRDDKMRHIHRVKGLRLKPAITSAQLSGLVLEELQPGQNYTWRVFAYDIDGALLGASKELQIKYREANQ